MAHVALVFSVFCLTLISLSLSKRMHLEQCPTNIVPKPGIDMNKLSGTWIEYAKYGFSIKKAVPLCSRLEFGKEDRGEIIMIKKHNAKRWTNSKDYKLVHEAAGKYDVQVPDEKGIEMSAEEKQLRNYERIQKKKTTFYILDTDYDCWVITYQCKQKTKRIPHSVISSSLLVKNNTGTCLNEQIKPKYESVISNQLGAKTSSISWLYIDRC